MVKFAFLIPLLFLLVKPLFANETPTTYLVWRGSFTLSQISAVKDYGYKKNDQPIKITRSMTATNTNYGTISITTSTNADATAIASLLDQGKIQPLQKVYLKSAYDERIGGSVSWTEVEDCKSDPEVYVCFPPDWNRDWATVVVSSK